MRYQELGRYIRALERSGSDVNTIKVERALKIAIPITCIIIALFGAPLATSTQRGGAAWGIGLSLGVTVAFLIAIQLTKAIGGEGVLNPDLAAWLPNTLFRTRWTHPAGESAYVTAAVRSAGDDRLPGHAAHGHPVPAPAWPSSASRSSPASASGRTSCSAQRLRSGANRRRISR